MSMLQARETFYKEYAPKVNFRSAGKLSETTECCMHCAFNKNPGCIVDNICNSAEFNKAYESFCNTTAKQLAEAPNSPSEIIQMKDYYGWISPNSVCDIFVQKQK